MIKQTIKVGNSAGVLLPRKYLGNLVEVTIKSLNKEEIKEQILDIAKPYLRYIIGIYLVGSYARNENEADSDIDIVIITTKQINIKEVKNYHIICLEYNNLIKELEENIISIYPMLMEAEVILNENLLKNLLKKSVTKKNLKWHLKTSKSALRIIKKALETGEKELIVNNAIIYSLILRLREIYLADCILEKKIGSIKGLIKYSENLKIIKKLYKAYKEARDKNKIITKINAEEVREGYEFVKDRLEKQEVRINELKEKKKTIR